MAFSSSTPGAIARKRRTGRMPASGWQNACGKLSSSRGVVVRPGRARAQSNAESRLRSAAQTPSEGAGGLVTISLNRHDAFRTNSLVSPRSIHMSKRSFQLLGILVLGGSLMQAQARVLPDDVRAVADRISAAQLKRDLDYFASDELLGRNTPSPGFDKAAAHIVARLEKAGVKPLGDEGTYYQRYEMHDTQVDAPAAGLEIGGKRFGLGSDFVVRSLAAPVSGTFAVVYVGHGWVIPAKDLDPYAGVDVRGKLVLAHGPRALPKGIDIPQLGRITVGASNVIAEAARRGAAGVVFIPHDVSDADWKGMQTQTARRRELVPPVPSVYAAVPSTAVLLSRAVTEALFADERLPGADMLTRGTSSDYP